MKANFKKILGVLFVLILALAACGGSFSGSDDDAGDYYGYGNDSVNLLQEAEANYSLGIAAESAAYNEAAPAFEPSADGAANSPGRNTAAQERIVIKNADMSLVVSDPVQAQRAIAEMAENLGGFVVSSNRSNQLPSEARPNGSPIRYAKDIGQSAASCEKACTVAWNTHW